MSELKTHMWKALKRNIEKILSHSFGRVREKKYSHQSVG